jgi:hypothetical protein
LRLLIALTLGHVGDSRGQRSTTQVSQVASSRVSLWRRLDDSVEVAKDHVRELSDIRRSGWLQCVQPPQEANVILLGSTHTPPVPPGFNSQKFSASLAGAWLGT